jgi:hypothetical protein
MELDDPFVVVGQGRSTPFRPHVGQAPHEERGLSVPRLDGAIRLFHELWALLHQPWIRLDSWLPFL